MVAKYILPNVGSVTLVKLAPVHIHGMQRALADRGLAPRTIRQAHSILREALADAEQLEYVTRNVAAKVKPVPIGQAKTDDALTEEEARALLAAGDGDRLAALVTVGLAIGLRRGEMLGLKWEDIDLDARLLTVRRTLAYRSGHGLVTGTPKTRASGGTVPLPAICVDSLRRRRFTQNKERLAAGPSWTESGYVFTTPIGTPLDPRNVLRWFHSITEEIGLGKRRLHALRHSAATRSCTNKEFRSN